MGEVCAFLASQKLKFHSNREATGGSHSFEEDTKAGERYFRHQLKTL